MQLNIMLRDPKADAMIPNVVCSGLRDHSIASTLCGERTKTQLLTQRKPARTFYERLLKQLDHSRKQ